MNGKKLLFKYLNPEYAVEGDCIHGRNFILPTLGVCRDDGDVHRVGSGFPVRLVRKRRQRVLGVYFLRGSSHQRISGYAHDVRTAANAISKRACGPAHSVMGIGLRSIMMPMPVLLCE